MKDHFIKKTVKSPAKVNLCLYINFKREDSFHDITSVMIPVSLYDELTFKVTPNPEIDVVSDNSEIPSGKDNLVYKAAEILQKKHAVKSGVKIKIKKKIPAGAGLGGGSSNAATTLTTLNNLWNLNLGKDKLKTVGKGIGADIPFFIEGSPSLIRGIGEIAEPITISSAIWVIIINPSFAVSTKHVYESLNLALTKKDKDIKNFLRLLALKGLSSEWTKHIHNDLETVTLEEYPELQRIKAFLIENGAVASLMAGSGSSVFGIYGSRKDAEIAFKETARIYKKVYLAKGITQV